MVSEKINGISYKSQMLFNKKASVSFNVIFYISTIFKNNCFLKLNVGMLMIKLVIL